MRIEVDGDRAMFALQSGDSRELHDIVTILMPEWAQLFARKNAEYGGGENGNASVLGIKGQYADIWRKMSKLKRAMWDGEQLEFEGTEEVISDMIGHLFLTLYMLRIREETDRSHVYSPDSTDVFVNRLIDELGGPEQALRVSGALSEALSSQVTARCRQMASEGFYEPDADAPVDPDDEEHSAREAVRRYDREVATPANKLRISVNEYEAMQQEAAARRLRKGADERLLSDYPGGVKAALRDHKSAPRDGFASEEFAASDARQHGYMDTIKDFVKRRSDITADDLDEEVYGEAEAKVGPARIVTEQQDGVTRYFHEAYPGSDREPLVLVPSALIGRLEKDHYVLSQDTKGGLRELAEWAERQR
jgi:hypothetical protein